MKSRLIPIFLLMVSNAATGTVVETGDYLPYGTRWSQTGGSAAQTLSDPDNRWRYSGKEEQQTLHQDLPLIDYGARMYDPAVARWMSPDPLAEKYYPMGQYIYCGNNSVNVIDPLGDDWYSVKDEKGQIQYKYDDNIKSKTDLKKLNISGNYLGKTYLSHDKYYSLFGAIIQYKSDTGDLTLEGQLFKGIESANGMDVLCLLEIIISIRFKSNLTKKMLHYSGKHLISNLLENER